MRMQVQLLFPSTFLNSSIVPLVIFLRESFRVRSPLFALWLGSEDLKLLVLTVATEATDGYERFMRSCRANNIDVKVWFN